MLHKIYNRIDITKQKGKVNMMKLKQEIDYGEFITAITACHGDVYFDTIDNDHLNLKSTLSQFIFASALSQYKGSLNGTINCKVEEDYQCLQSFLESETNA